MTTQQNEQNGNEQKDAAGPVSRSDTTSPGGARPVQGQSGKVGADIAGAAGSDAAAGATGLGEASPADDTHDGAGGSPGT